LSTLRCCDTAGLVTGSSSAISPTAIGSLARHSKIARLVGSPRAPSAATPLVSTNRKLALTNRVGQSPVAPIRGSNSSGAPTPRPRSQIQQQQSANAPIPTTPKRQRCCPGQAGTTARGPRCGPGQAGTSSRGPTLRSPLRANIRPQPAATLDKRSSIMSSEIVDFFRESLCCAVGHRADGGG